MQKQSFNCFIVITVMNVFRKVYLLTVMIHNILHKRPIFLSFLPQFSCLKIRDFMLKVKGQVLFHIFSAIKGIDVSMKFTQMKMFRMVFNAFCSPIFLDSLSILADLQQTID